MIVSRSFLLRMRNVSDESCRDAHSMLNYFFLGNRAVYEIMGGKPGTARQTDMRFVAAKVFRLVEVFFQGATMPPPRYTPGFCKFWLKIVKRSVSTCELFFSECHHALPPTPRVL